MPHATPKCCQERTHGSRASGASHLDDVVDGVDSRQKSSAALTSGGVGRRGCGPRNGQRGSACLVHAREQRGAPGTGGRRRASISCGRIGRGGERPTLRTERQHEQRPGFADAKPDQAPALFPDESQIPSQWRAACSMGLFGAERPGTGVGPWVSSRGPWRPLPSAGTSPTARAPRPHRCRS